MVEFVSTPFRHTSYGNFTDVILALDCDLMSRAHDLCLPNVYLKPTHFQPFSPVL